MDYININRELWNQRTEIHFNSDFYNVTEFLNGKSSLNPVEIELLGDVTNKSILHLQCHFGLDSISLSKIGAHVTGVDFSNKAIIKAKSLAKTLGTNTQFVESDIYNVPNILNQQFDIVFTSYGTVGWLPNMSKWANVIHHFLKPGGTFIMVEFHPVVWMFSNDFKHIEFNYMDFNPIIEEEEGTYADKKAPLKTKSVSWNHGLATVIDALIKSGLTITQFNEYNYSPYNCFENTLEVEKGKFQIKGLENKIPMLYALTAVKRTQ